MKLKLSSGRFVNLSATQCYSQGDVDSLLRKHMRSNRITIDFAGEYIPIETDAEIRIVSALVCSYHNACVRENLQDQTYEPYIEDSEREEESIKDGEELTALDTQGWAVCVAKNYSVKRPKTHPDERSNQENWDEELLGERVVFDSSFEMNEDLVPWKQDRFSHWGEEKWGMYE